MSDNLKEMLDKKGPIRNIGVIGMGYVGIPAAALFANLDCFDSVLGFQRDSSSSGYKIGMLNSGECPLKGNEPGLDELIKKVVAAEKFECTSDFSRIADMDAVTLAIQTPFADPASLEPDFDALIEGIRQVGRYLSKGTLVVLESTITPGTTEGLAQQVLEEEAGLIAGVDFALAHAPERVMVGRLLQNIQEHDRIVGGIDDVSTARAVELYSPVLTKGKVIPMSATAAEVTKTTENTLRDLQIASINQLALYCEAMGINVYDVRAGVDSLKGEGITRAVLYPGAGVGGHCLTKDTYHLERGVKISKGKLDYPAGLDSIFVLARKVNDFMPVHMYNLTVEALARAGKKPSGSRVAILGWAFLNNSDDARNPPSAPYRNLLIEAGCEVEVHDPHVLEYPEVDISHELNDVVKGADVVAVLTGHDEYLRFDAKVLKGLMGQEYPVIVDGRNVVDADGFIGAGFVYKGIGRGDKNGHEMQ